MNDLKSKLANLLEVDSVNGCDVLEEFDCWDSLTILSIISLSAETYNKPLSADAVRDSKTIENLCKLILE